MGTRSESGREEAATAAATAMAETGPRIIWNKKKHTFETEDKKAYLEYVFSESESGGKVMDIIHTFVPASKRGQGLASHLCIAAFNHAKSNSMAVIPTCSYVSDTFLPRNPVWNSVLRNGSGSGGVKSSI